jgi:hypothetical protein
MGSSFDLRATLTQWEALMRYQVGFPKGVQSGLTERNPGCPPVVEVGGVWGWGRVVCICDSLAEAELIANMLNLHQAMKEQGWRI